MGDLKKKLAKISKFKLNVNDRGILMFWIDVDYEDGLSQGVGGLVLDEYLEGNNGSLGKRVGTAYGCEMIRQLMLTLEVDDFNDAKDKIIYILGEGEGFSFKPKGIQTLSVYGNKKSLVFDDLIYLLENKEVK